jgi:hypothetical protein
MKMVKKLNSYNLDNPFFYSGCIKIHNAITTVVEISPLISETCYM